MRNENLGTDVGVGNLHGQNKRLDRPKIAEKRHKITLSESIPLQTFLLSFKWQTLTAQGFFSTPRHPPCSWKTLDFLSIKFDVCVGGDVCGVWGQEVQDAAGRGHVAEMTPDIPHTHIPSSSSTHNLSASDNKVLMVYYCLLKCSWCVIVCCSTRSFNDQVRLIFLSTNIRASNSWFPFVGGQDDDRWRCVAPEWLGGAVEQDGCWCVCCDVTCFSTLL